MSVKMIIEKECVTCGKIIILDKSQRHQLKKGSNNFYCNITCYEQKRNIVPMKIPPTIIEQCFTCQKHFTLSGSQKNHYYRHNQKRFFCSRYCWYKFVPSIDKNNKVYDLRIYDSKDGSKYLSIPKHLLNGFEFPYMRVKISKETTQIILSPALKPNRHTKRVGGGKYATYLRLPQAISDLVDLGETNLTLKSATIVWTLSDPEFLRPFIAWASGKAVIKSTKDCNYNYGKGNGWCSIANWLWPINAEYVLVEKVSRHTITILPVTSEGFVIENENKELGQYVGVENCVKVYLHAKRFRFCAQSFVNANPDLPAGEYRFIGRSRQGHLKFKAHVKEAYRLRKE